VKSSSASGDSLRYPAHLVDGRVRADRTARSGQEDRGLLTASDRFDTISAYATERLALFIGKRHKRGRRCGLSVLAYRVPDRCGLIRLSGIVVAPRANKPWRERPNVGGERRR
jgi:hypothetical protein